MERWLLYGVAIVVAAVVLDRLLLWCEARGWINYRRNGLSRTGPLYHALDLHSIFDPGIQQVTEIQYQERKEQDESGDPLGPNVSGEPPRPAG